MYDRFIKFIAKNSGKIAVGAGTLGVAYIANKSDKFSFNLYHVLGFSKESKPEGTKTKIKNVSVKKDITVTTVSDQKHISTDIENAESKGGGLTVKTQDSLSKTHIVNTQVGRDVLINSNIFQPLRSVVSEQEIAEKILIFMKDKRVLQNYHISAQNMQYAIQSIDQIRKFLLGKEIDFSHVKGTAIFKLTESIREITRSFLTFEEDLRKNNPGNYDKACIDKLENLRISISSILNEIREIADNTNKGKEEKKDAVVHSMTRSRL